MASQRQNTALVQLSYRKPVSSPDNNQNRRKIQRVASLPSSAHISPLVQEAKNDTIGHNNDNSNGNSNENSNGKTSISPLVHNRRPLVRAATVVVLSPPSQIRNVAQPQDLRGMLENEYHRVRMNRLSQPLPARHLLDAPVVKRFAWTPGVGKGGRLVKDAARSAPKTELPTSMSLDQFHFNFRKAETANRVAEDGIAANGRTDIVADRILDGRNTHRALENVWKQAADRDTLSFPLQPVEEQHESESLVEEQANSNNPMENVGRPLLSPKRAARLDAVSTAHLRSYSASPITPEDEKTPSLRHRKYASQISLSVPAEDSAHIPFPAPTPPRQQRTVVANNASPLHNRSLTLSILNARAASSETLHVRSHSHVPGSRNNVHSSEFPSRSIQSGDIRSQTRTSSSVYYFPKPTQSVESKLSSAFQRAASVQTRPRNLPRSPPKEEIQIVTPQSAQLDVRWASLPTKSRQFSAPSPGMKTSSLSYSTSVDSFVSQERRRETAASKPIPKAMMVDVHKLRMMDDVVPFNANNASSQSTSMARSASDHGIWTPIPTSTKQSASPSQSLSSFTIRIDGDNASSDMPSELGNNPQDVSSFSLFKTGGEYPYLVEDLDEVGVVEAAKPKAISISTPPTVVSRNYQGLDYDRFEKPVLHSRRHSAEERAAKLDQRSSEQTEESLTLIRQSTVNHALTSFTSIAEDVRREIVGTYAQAIPRPPIIPPPTMGLTRPKSPGRTNRQSAPVVLDKFQERPRSSPPARSRSNTSFPQQRFEDSTSASKRAHHTSTNSFDDFIMTNAYTRTPSAASATVLASGASGFASLSRASSMTASVAPLSKNRSSPVTSESSHDLGMSSSGNVSNASNYAVAPPPATKQHIDAAFLWQAQNIPIPHLPALPAIGLPALPSLLLSLTPSKNSTAYAHLIPDIRGPTPYSNWVIPGRLLCGAWPGRIYSAKPLSLDAPNVGYKRLLQNGVDTFVSLVLERSQEEYMTEAREYHLQILADRDDATLRQMRDSFNVQSSATSGPGVGENSSSDRQLSGRNASLFELLFLHFPIKDQQPATEIEAFRAFLEHLLVLLCKGRVLYIHCWGGHGRTGMAVAYMLKRLFPSMSVREALERVQIYHDLRVDSNPFKSTKAFSPATIYQIKQVYELLHMELPASVCREFKARHSKGRHGYPYAFKTDYSREYFQSLLIPPLDVASTVPTIELRIQLVTDQVVPLVVSHHHTIGSLYRLVSEVTQLPLERFVLRLHDSSQLFIHFDALIGRLDLANAYLLQEYIS